MNTGNEIWSYLSIFYEREQWHLLLEMLRKEFFENTKYDKESIHAFVFLSMHRGANIRLALNYSKSSENLITNLAKKIDVFLREKPASEKELTLPINSLFMNFPTNQIHYNLFNQHALMDEGLIVYQDIISKVLVQFFEDHPVDEDGLFTLLIYLQEAILNGICVNRTTKQQCCLQLRQLIRDKDYSLASITGIEYMPLHLVRKCLVIQLGDFSVQLENLTHASKILYRINQDFIKTYITILKIIQQQLFNVSGKIIFDSICHIHQAATHELYPKENIISESFILHNV